MKLLAWIFAMILPVPVALAQTGLFGNSGAPFLTVGVFILIIFFIGDSIFRQIQGKK